MLRGIVICRCICGGFSLLLAIDLFKGSISPCIPLSRCLNRFSELFYIYDREDVVLIDDVVFGHTH